MRVRDWRRLTLAGLVAGLAVGAEPALAQQAETIDRLRDRG